MDSLREWTLAACLVTIVSGANAAGMTDITWSADLGTTGFGLHASLPLSTQYGLHGRIGVNYLNEYTFSRGTSQIHYDLNATLRTIDALIDWYPHRSGFRLTAGLVYNNNRVDGIGTPTRVSTFAFENGSFSTTQLGKVVGQIDFQQISPYLGIGWQTQEPDKHGWSVSSDIGVMYQGSPRTHLSISDCALPGNACALLLTALEPVIANENRRVNAQLKDYAYFPVVRIGLNYRF